MVAHRPNGPFISLEPFAQPRPNHHTNYSPPRCATCPFRASSGKDRLKTNILLILAHSRRSSFMRRSCLAPEACHNGPILLSAILAVQPLSISLYNCKVGLLCWLASWSIFDIYFCCLVRHLHPQAHWWALLICFYVRGAYQPSLIMKPRSLN